MADPDFEILDGFDHYHTTIGSTINALALLNEWTSIGISWYLRAPLGGTGYSVSGNSGLAYRDLGANYARCVGGVTVQPATIVSMPYHISFMDGSTYQCSIGWDGTGKLGAYRAQGGTLLGAESGISMSAGVTHCIEWDITVHNTAGIMKVWVDGVLVINLSGVDTCNNSNQYSNRFGFYYPGSAANIIYDDHLYLWYFTASGGSETPCLDNPIIQTDRPTSNSAVAFDLNLELMGPVIDEGINWASYTCTSSRCYFNKWVAGQSGDLNTILLNPASSYTTLHWRVAIYSDSGGNPSTLLGSSAEITGGLTSGAFTAANLSSTVTVTSGTTYWIALICDANLNMRGDDSSNARYMTNTYASGFPASPGSFTNTEVLSLWGVIETTGGNYVNVSGSQPVDYQYNGTSTVGDIDQLGFSALASSPATIHRVGVKAAVSRSASGARTFALSMVSSATTGYGTAGSSGKAPGATFGYYTTILRKDPNGAITWTKGGLDAATCGYEVIS